MHKGFLTLRSSYLTKILKISTLHLCQKSKQWKTRPPPEIPQDLLHMVRVILHFEFTQTHFSDTWHISFFLPWRKTWKWSITTISFVLFFLHIPYIYHKFTLSLTKTMFLQCCYVVSQISFIMIAQFKYPRNKPTTYTRLQDFSKNSSCTLIISKTSDFSKQANKCRWI